MSKKINAIQALQKCTRNANKYAMDQIQIAQKKGHTRCYVNYQTQKPPVATLLMLLGKGYDLYFTYLHGEDHMYVQADWSDGACCRIINNSLGANDKEISLSELKSIMTKHQDAPTISEEDE